MDINQYTAVDNNKEILTNVFVKGMNTDTSDMLLGEDLYRYAENIRIVTDTASNTGEARIIEGNKKIKIEGLIGNKILATNSIRNLGVFVTLKSGNETNSGWYIFTCDFNNPLFSDGNKYYEAKKIFGPCKTSISKEYQDAGFFEQQNRFKKTITTVLRWESDDNVKLYMADGIHELMMIQLIVNDDYVAPTDFEEVFGSLNTVLPKLTADIFDYPGSVQGPVVQYAYRLYEENGASTPLSSLTGPLSLYQDSNNQKIGIRKDLRSTQAVSLHMDNINISGPMNYIQIYRIDYVQIGLAPKVSLVYDGDIIYSFTDYGSTQQTTISDADLLAMIKMQMVPSIIESKDNYLFAGSIKYQLDDIDKQFENFDARAYNKGMFILNRDNTRTYIIAQGGQYNFPSIDQQDDLSSNQLYGNNFENYVSEDWGKIEGTDEYNGIGPYIAWKYVPMYHNNTRKTDQKYYRRGEVYRFGIRLFDSKGRASSVKWIADIQFPLNEDTDYNLFYYVLFIPINTNLEAWSNVYGYEIVLCERTIDDRIRLFSGIIGHVNTCDVIYEKDGKSLVNRDYESYIYPNGYISMMNITGNGGNLYTRAYGNLGSDSWVHRIEWFTGDDVNTTRDRGIHPQLRSEFYYSHPANNIFQFVCPEAIYLKDDVKNVLLTFSNGIYVDINRMLVAPGQQYYPDTPSDFEGPHKDRVEYVAISCSLSSDFTNNAIYNLIKYLYNTPMSFVSSNLLWSMQDAGKNYLPRNVLSVLYKNDGGIENIISNGSYEGCETEYNVNLATVLLNYCPLEPDYTSYELPLEIVRRNTNNQLYLNTEYNSDNHEHHLINTHITDYTKQDETIYSENRIWKNFSTKQDDSVYHLARYCIKHHQEKNMLLFHTACKIDTGFSNETRLLPTKIHRKINNFTVVDALDDKSFGTEDGKNFSFNNKLNAIAGKSFINCTNGFLNTAIKEIPTVQGNEGHDAWYLKHIFTTYGSTNDFLDRNPFNPREDEAHKQRSTWARSVDTGFGGSCILLNTDVNITESLVIGDNAYLKGRYKIENMPAVSIADITRSNIIPYNGITKNSINQSKYISIGSYKTCSQGNYPSIDALGGDTFFLKFNYCSSHTWYDPYFFVCSLPTILYSVYLETDINLLGLTSDTLLGYNTLDYRVQEKATSYGEGDYTQEQDQYTYNTAYGSVANLVTYTPNRTTKALTNNYDVRIHNSQKKTNGELVDSWMLFKATDFIDVDTLYGPVTALKTFKNKLIFWQDLATGVLSVNERSIVQDANKTHIVLGTGGILDRYDYFTTIFGLKLDQHNQTQSDSTLYWWDGNNKEILGYSDGYNISQLSTIKSIKNYINQRNETDIPALMYNKKYREVICNTVDTGGSIIYSEPVQAFTSIYTYYPEFCLDVKNSLYTTQHDITDPTDLTNYIYIENAELEQGNSKLFGTIDCRPKIQYVVNKSPQSTKTFDIQTLGGRFYGGDNLNNLVFKYNTPLKQHSETSGLSVVTNREYDFRLAIPRDGSTISSGGFDHKTQWGNRMRGKFMDCTISSTSNNTDFSLQYITTKFRTSWA